MPTEDKALRDHLLEMLRGGSAHVDLATVVDDFPAKLTGTKLKNAPYTPWQVLEHIRFTVNDLLLFSTDPKYVAPKWPDDYWPAKETPQAGEWEASVKALKADLGGVRRHGSRPEGESLREDSLGRWADAAARGAPCVPAHELSSGRNGFDAQRAGRVEISVPLISSSRRVASAGAASRSCAGLAHTLPAL